MRYFIYDINNIDSIKFIASEMINFEFGIRYFKNGKFNNKKEIDYNSFELDDIQFNFIPSYGYIILPNKKILLSYFNKIVKCYKYYLSILKEKNIINTIVI